METPRKASTQIPSVAEAKRRLAQALGRPLPKRKARAAVSKGVQIDTPGLSRDPHVRYPHLFEFYCPQCGVAKRLPFSPQPGMRHFLQIGLTSALIMAALWPWSGVKGAVVFLPLWMIFEVSYRMRVRARMRCTHCGFDPFLYVTDVGRARREMVEHWRKLYEDRGLKYPPEYKPWWTPDSKGGEKGEAQKPLPTPEAKT